MQVSTEKTSKIMTSCVLILHLIHIMHIFGEWKCSHHTNDHACTCYCLLSF